MYKMYCSCECGMIRSRREICVQQEENARIQREASSSLQPWRDASEAALRKQIQSLEAKLQEATQSLAASEDKLIGREFEAAGYGSITERDTLLAETQNLQQECSRPPPSVIFRLIDGTINKTRGANLMS